MSIPQQHLDRIEGMANAVIEFMKQLKSSIETTSTRLNAAMLREQTLENVTVILALYKDSDPKDYSAPSIIIANHKNQVCAAVVRTYYNKGLRKSVMVTTIKGRDRTSEFKALESLYTRSRDAVQRAIALSKNPNGFDDWLDLDLFL